MSTQCRFCGEAVRPDSMFCPACGQLIGAVAGVVPPFPGTDAAPTHRESSPAMAAPAIDPVPLPAPRRPAPKSDAQPPVEAPPQTPPPANQKPVEQKLVEQKPAEQKPAGQKPAEQKPAEQKPAGQSPTSMMLPDGKRLALDRVLVLGRSPEQGAAAYNGIPVRLDDPERAMSRVHLVVSPTSRGVTATDPGSANGTLLERAGTQYALVSATPTSLLSGDRVLLGDVTLTFS